MPTKQKIITLLQTHSTLHTCNHFSSSAFHGTILSLSSNEVITYDQITTQKYVFTDDGIECIKNGSPEFQFYCAIKNNQTQNESGKSQALKNGWIKFVDGQLKINKEGVFDEVANLLRLLKNEENCDRCVGIDGEILGCQFDNDLEDSEESDGMKKIESDGMKNIESDGMKNIESDGMKNIDIKSDDVKNVNMKNIDMKSDDVKNVNMKNIDMKSDDVKNVNMKNVNMKNIDIKSDDVKNIDLKSVDVKNIKKCVDIKNLIEKNLNINVEDEVIKINKDIPDTQDINKNLIKKPTTLKKQKNFNRFFLNLNELTKQQIALLQKRKFISVQKVTKYVLKKGPNFEFKKEKAFNFDTKGLIEKYGALHPLNKIKSEIKSIFLEMGFEEMDTSNFVESSFWNFDALFQPQAHPARDAHDTFFVDDGAVLRTDSAYFNAVRNVHEKAYRARWSAKEADKLVLRTHTTACTARTLYKLAKNFKPSKFFSIDRVFRNESVDATHLAEFHQVEGVVIDRNLNISHLMGLLEEFFKRLKIPNIRFKPAYNPYTEPSMEVYAVHEKIGLMEIGNSGVFRPEMLRTMGFDEDVRAVAWGLSLERPAMIKFGCDNIRELMGHKVDLEFVRKGKIVMFD